MNEVTLVVAQLYVEVAAVLSLVIHLNQAQPARL